MTSNPGSYVEREHRKWLYNPEAHMAVPELDAGSLARRSKAAMEFLLLHKKIDEAEAVANLIRMIERMTK